MHCFNLVVPVISALALAACTPEAPPQRPATPPPVATAIAPVATTPAQAKPRPDGGMLIDWRPTPGAALPTLWSSDKPSASSSSLQTNAGGTPCWHLSHTAPPPPAKTYAFYRIPLDKPLMLPPATDLVLEADLTVHPQVQAEVVTGVSLIANLDYYGDSGVLASGNVLPFASVVPRPERQQLVSLPVNRSSAVVADARVKKIAITGLAVMINKAHPASPMDIELYSLRLRHADARDRERASRPPPQIDGLPPRDYPIMQSSFRFGTWSDLACGASRYAAREEFILCGLETLLAAGIDNTWTKRVHSDLDPERTDEEISIATLQAEIALAHRLGMDSIVKAYLGRYYHPQRTAAQAKAYIADTAAKLRGCAGLVAYTPIDEPHGDQRGLEVWRETMDAFRTADPDHPAISNHDSLEGALVFAPAEAVPCLDLYPFGTDGRMLDQTGGDVLRTSRILDEMFRVRGTRSTWVMFAAWGNAVGFSHRLARASEVRLQAWSALAHGARSLFNFTHHGLGLRGDPHAREGVLGIFDAGYRPFGEAGAAAIELGRDLPPAATALVGTVWQPEVALRCAGENPDRLHASWNHGADHDVIACYNRDIDRTSAGSIIIPGDLLAGRKVLDLRRDRVLSAADGGYPICLAPGDGTILALGDEAGIARLRAAAAARRFAGDAGRFRLLALEAAANRIDVAPFERDAAAAQAALAGDPIAAQRAMAEVLARLRWTLADDAVYVRAHAALERLSLAISAANAGMVRHLSDARGNDTGADGALVYPWNGQLESLSTTYVLLRNGLFCGRGAEVIGQAHAIAAVAERFAADAALARFAVTDGDVQRVAAALASAKAFAGLVAPVLGLVPAK